MLIDSYDSVLEVGEGPFLRERKRARTREWSTTSFHDCD